MTTRGNWGAAEGVEPNSHGNFRQLLKAIREMLAVRQGKVSAPRIEVKKANPEWFDGNQLSKEGNEVLDKVLGLIPAAVSKDGIKFLEERNENRSG